MKKLLIITVSLILLSGCRSEDSKRAEAERARSKQGFTEKCLGGVTYIQYYGAGNKVGFFALTVKLGTDSKIIKCTNGI